MKNETAAEVIPHEEAAHDSPKEVAPLPTNGDLQPVVLSTPMQMLGQLVKKNPAIQTLPAMVSDVNCRPS